MKLLLLLPAAACLLTSCAIHDPDYVRQAAQIQNIEYPPNTIVGMWMQVGYGKVTGLDLVFETRLYYQFNSDGKGVCRLIRMIPAVYNEYKDLYPRIKNFDGEQTIESDFTWRYLGNNKWEVVKSGNARLISDPPWMKTRLTGNKGSSKLAIVRFHNNQLFFPDFHSTAVSMSNEAAAKAKLDSIRESHDRLLRTMLQLKRTGTKLKMAGLN